VGESLPKIARVLGVNDEPRVAKGRAGVVPVMLAGTERPGLADLVDVRQEHAYDYARNAEAHARGVGFSSRRAENCFISRYRCPH
jgi:hypothetical protein